MYNNYLIPKQVNGLWGYINRHGEMVIAPEYQSADPFTGMIAKVFNGQNYELINDKGDTLLDMREAKIILREDLDGYEFQIDGESGLISFDLRIFTHPQYSFIGVLAEGLIPACREGFYGFLNGRLEEAIPFNYLFAEPFRYGVARVKTKAGKTILIDRTGTEVDDSEYEYASDDMLRSFFHSPRFKSLVYRKTFTNNVRIYSHPKKSIYTALVGNKSFPLAKYFKAIELLSNSYIKVELDITDSEGNKTPFSGVFDTQGNQILPPIFQQIEYLSADCFKVQMDGKWGIINKNLEILLEPVYDYIHKPIGELISLTQNSSLILSTGNPDLFLTKWIEGRLIDIGYLPAKADGYTAFYDPTESLNCYKYQLFSSARINHPENTGLDEETIKLCVEDLEKDFLYSEKKISHGTIPVPDIIEFDGPRGFDDIGFDKFIEALAKDELWNHKIFTLDDLNDPTVWMASKFFDAKDEFAIIAEQVIDFEDLLNDLNAEETDEEDEENSFNAPFSDDESDMNFGPQEEDDDLSKLLNPDTEETNEDPYSHKFRKFRKSAFVTNRFGNPVFMSNKPNVIKWGEGSYIVWEDKKEYTEGTLLNSRWEALDPEIHPVQNDLDLTGGYLRVVCRGKYGFVDNQGDLALEPNFNSLSQFIKGKALGITSKSAFVFTSALEFSELPLKITNFHSWDGKIASGCISTPKGEKWGIFNDSGKVIVPFEYDYIKHIGEMTFIIKVDGHFGVINAKRELLVNPKYISYERDETSILTLKQVGGFYDLFDVRTQKLITQFTMENKQYPIKPTYVSDLGEGFLFLETRLITGYLDLSSPTNSRLITEKSK